MPRRLSSTVAGVAVGAVLMAAGFGLAPFGLAQGEGAPLSTPAVTVAVHAVEVPAVELTHPDALVLGPANSQRPGAPAPVLPDLSGLRAQGFWIEPVASIEVLNASAAVAPDPALARASGFDVVTSGTFYFSSGGALYPAGAVMRDGTLETSPPAKTAHRGGLAIRADGSILIGQQQGNGAADIQRVFGHGSPVVDFMGGGALLIDAGRKVPVSELGADAATGGQQFDQGGRGFAAGQMRRTNHVVLAIRDGQLYVIGARDMSGEAIQSRLLAAGFTAALKYDGGSGSYLRHEGGALFSNTNPTGFGIQLRR